MGNIRLLVCAGALGATALPAIAQSLVMSLPRQSQRASVSQRVALTDITIVYHRPLAGGRKIWGAPNLAPYGQVWRAGANENTTFEVTDPVTVEGQRLEKGVYGLHMIPERIRSWRSSRRTRPRGEVSRTTRKKTRCG